jgi:hypothetical protein
MRCSAVRKRASRNHYCFTVLKGCRGFIVESRMKSINANNLQEIRGAGTRHLRAGKAHSRSLGYLRISCQGLWRR